MTEGDSPPRLLLDEHYPEALAQALRDRGHDVVAAVRDAGLRGAPDALLFAAAQRDGRWIVTENVKDFRPLLQACVGAGVEPVGLLLVDGRRFPRTPAGLPVLARALSAWLSQRRDRATRSF